jgi:hypothetical protein
MVIYLEGVTLESLREPEGVRRADEIFARNERILFPLLMSSRYSLRTAGRGNIPASNLGR